MFKLETILVPIDFEESSDAATDYALTLARQLGASIVAMHAYETPVRYPAYPLVSLGDVSPAMAAAAQTGLDAALERMKRAWPKVTGVLREGKAWRAIIEVAGEHRADLIVMGTHGRHGLAHAMLGSVAERVVRASPVPVMTIRARPSVEESDTLERLERRLSSPTEGTMDTAALSGAIAGATLGAVAGPPGMVAGGLVGSAMGAAAGLILDQEEARKRAVTARLDADLGVVGGNLGAAAPDLPPARVGAFSGSSAGVALPASSTPSEGPMQDPSADD